MDYDLLIELVLIVGYILVAIYLDVLKHELRKLKRDFEEYKLKHK